MARFFMFHILILGKHEVTFFQAGSYYGENLFYLLLFTYGAGVDGPFRDRIECCGLDWFGLG
jgi:hypothetical protein